MRRPYQFPVQSAATPVTPPAQPCVSAGRTERPSWTPSSRIFPKRLRPRPTRPRCRTTCARRRNRRFRAPRAARRKRRSARCSPIWDDPNREGLVETPKRFVNAYEELFAGYKECPAEALDRTFSETGGYDDLVLVRDIPFYSHCEHHVMPFTGRAHIAYMPVERVVGLSKIARLIDVYARRLQTQEHLTSQIATAIDEILNPRGVAVMLEAEHTCMSMRGVAKPGSLTLTTRFTGLFRSDPQEQVRFITMVRSAR